MTAIIILLACILALLACVAWLLLRLLPVRFPLPSALLLLW